MQLHAIMTILNALHLTLATVYFINSSMTLCYKHIGFFQCCIRTEFEFRSQITSTGVRCMTVVSVDRQAVI